MAVVTLAGVVMRFVLKIPNMWGEEITRYLMVLGVYLGVACGCRTRSHLSVEGIVARLPKAAARTVNILTRLIVIGAYILFAVYAVKLTMTQFEMGQTSPAMQLPMWIVYVVLTAGFVLAALAETLLFFNDFVAKEPFLIEHKKRGSE
jgi:C4-dicarboxylate transporter DctQ subunit